MKQPHDTQLCRQVLKRNLHQIQTITADKGYSWDEFRLYLRGEGVRPVIKHREFTSLDAAHNARIDDGTYHRRSVVESVFATLRRRLDDTIRARTWFGQHRLDRVSSHPVDCPGDNADEIFGIYYNLFANPNELHSRTGGSKKKIWKYYYPTGIADLILYSFTIRKTGTATGKTYSQVIEMYVGDSSCAGFNGHGDETTCGSAKGDSGSVSYNTDGSEGAKLIGLMNSYAGTTSGSDCDGDSIGNHHWGGAIYEIENRWPGISWYWSNLRNGHSPTQLLGTASG